MPKPKNAAMNKAEKRQKTNAPASNGKSSKEVGMGKHACFLQLAAGRSETWEEFEEEVLKLIPEDAGKC